MAFFGLTTLGSTDPIRDATKTDKEYLFHTIPQERYEEVFNKHLIGDSDIAIALEVDGSIHIPRAKLGDLLKDLLGRQPRKFELDCWFTHLDFDRSAVMGIEEYFKGVDKVVAFSASTATPVQYASFDTQRTDWVRHARVGYEQQQTLARPLTTAQEVGWHAPKPEPPGATARRTLGSTDVTQREGNTAASYYGHFICN